MKDINNFKNLLEVTGRNFLKLQEKLMAIPHPANILDIGAHANGVYYAIVMLDRPVKKPRGKKAEVAQPTITETVENTQA